MNDGDRCNNGGKQIITEWLVEKVDAEGFC